MASTTNETNGLTEEEAWPLWEDIIEWAKDGAPADWQDRHPDDKIVRGRFEPATEEKYNPYHESGTGRFTSEGGAGFVSLPGKPDKGFVGPADGIGEDYSPQRMAAKRDAMISEHTRRSEALDRRQLAAQMTLDAKTEDNRKLALASQLLGRDEVRLRDEVRSIQRDIDEQHGIPDSALPDARRFLAGRLQEYHETVEAHNVAFAKLQADEPNLKAATQEYADKIDGITAERQGLNAEIRAKYVNAPEGPGNMTMQAAVRGASNEKIPITPGMAPQTWRDGLTAVNEITGNILSVGKSEVPMTAMRTDDQWYASGRSYQTSANLGITLHPTDARVSTIVHEMGHQIESQEPSLTSRIWEHIDSRTQGESNRKLSEVTGGNYNDNEVTKTDNFASAYMGKDYNRQASEFLSMSMQMMYEDPVGFAKKDARSFDFTSQLLAEMRANGQVQPTQALADAWMAADTAQAQWELELAPF